MRELSVRQLWTGARVACAAIGGALGFFVGGADGLLLALAVMMALDYVTGVMCAVVERRLSSAVGFRGICKKVVILMLVGVANVADRWVIGSGSALRGAVICFYLSNEALSLFENAARLGLPVPEALKQALAQGKADRE